MQESFQPAAGECHVEHLLNTEEIDGSGFGQRQIESDISRAMNNVGGRFDDVLVIPIRNPQPFAADIAEDRPDPSGGQFSRLILPPDQCENLSAIDQSQDFRAQQAGSPGQE